MGFNSAFKGLTQVPDRMSMRYSSCGVTPEEKKKGVKFTLEEATKAQRESSGIALLFL